MLHSIITKEKIIQQRRDSLEKRDERGNTPLIAAVIKQDLQEVIELVQKHKDLKVTLLQKSVTSQSNPLHYAVRDCNDISMLQYLLTTPLKKHINEPNSYGLTPAHIAASNQDLESLKTLYSKGADLQLKSITGNTAFDLLNVDLRQKFQSDHTKTRLFINSTAATKKSLNTKICFTNCSELDFKKCNVLTYADKGGLGRA